MHTLALFEMNPFDVPVAGCIMILGIAVAGIWSGIRHRELQSQERLAAIAAGVPIPPTAEELAIMHGKPQSDQKRRHANIRLTAIVLLASGAGILAFFSALAAILHQRDVLCGAAIGLIPLAIGFGFLIDAHRQAHEIETSKAETPTPPYSPYPPSL